MMRVGTTIIIILYRTLKVCIIYIIVNQSDMLSSIKLHVQRLLHWYLLRGTVQPWETSVAQWPS